MIPLARDKEDAERLSGNLNKRLTEITAEWESAKTEINSLQGSLRRLKEDLTTANARSTSVEDGLRASELDRQKIKGSWDLCAPRS